MYMWAMGVILYSKHRPPPFSYVRCQMSWLGHLPYMALTKPHLPDLAVLLAGYHPFDPAGNADDRLVEKRVRLMEWNFKGNEWKHVSRQAKNLIRKLLDIDPAKRTTVHELLSSSWVGGGAAPVEPLPASTKNRLKEFNEAYVPIRLRTGVFSPLRC